MPNIIHIVYRLIVILKTITANIDTVIVNFCLYNNLVFEKLENCNGKNEKHSYITWR